MPIPFEPIMSMADIAVDMLRSAIDAFMRQDATAADVMTERDREVDTLRDDMIKALVARMSTDATTVQESLALVFIVQSIERIGDHAKNIAEYVVNVVSGVDPRHAQGRLSAEARPV